MSVEKMANKLKKEMFLKLKKNMSYVATQRKIKSKQVYRNTNCVIFELF